MNRKEKKSCSYKMNYTGQINILSSVCLRTLSRHSWDPAIASADLIDGREL